MSKSISWLTVPLLVLFLVDRIIKYIILTKLPQEGVVIFPFFKFDLAFNQNIAFSIFIPTWLIFFLNSIIIIFLTYYLIKTVRVNKVVSFGLGLMIIGAVSNLIDRFKFDGVIDYVDFWIFPIFNLSDVYIIIGVILILLSIKKSQI